MLSFQTSESGINRYGWKPSAPDFRDEAYKYCVRSEIAKALPPSIDLRSGLDIFDQGPIGSCGPNSISKDILYSAQKQDILVNPPTPSRLFIYYATRSLMGTVNQDSGVDNRTMLKALAKYGWCNESPTTPGEAYWPYAPTNFKTQPNQACIQQALTRRIVAYHSVEQKLETMKGCLASGDPFIFGFTVYKSFESQQVAQTGIVPMPQPGEDAVGGHDVWICGYDDARQMFLLCNSWGANWGLTGYAWIPYAYALNPNLSGDFWTVEHSALPVPPGPGPIPPIPPVPPGPLPPGPGHTVLIDGVRYVPATAA